jgi:hypothetical protein
MIKFHDRATRQFSSPMSGYTMDTVLTPQSRLTCYHELIGFRLAGLVPA